MKSVKLIVYTNGYWRSFFLKDLFCAFAEVEIVDLRFGNEKKRYADFFLWERQIDKAPFDFINPSKLFIYDYEDESNRYKLSLFAKKFKIPNPRFLLLLPKSCHEDTFPLPLPPPSKLKKKYFFKPKKLKDRKNNSFFVGAPTYIISKDKFDAPFTVFQKDNYLYNQRLEWVAKLKQASLLRKIEGLTKKSDYLSSENIKKLFGEINVPYVGSLSQKDFYRELLNSKLIFCPGGHSRWTYRHIESFFYGALTISTDFAGLQSLPKFPLDSLVMIEDGKFDVKIISEIIENIEDFQEKADIGYDFARRTYKESLLHKNNRSYNFTDIAKKEIFELFFGWLDINCKNRYEV